MFKRKFVEIDPKLYKGVKILAISRGDTIRETVNNCLRKTYNLGGGHEGIREPNDDKRPICQPGRTG